MTYRERREARAQKLQEWAEKRDEKAAALIARNEPYRGDWAFATQPGHIPERARVIARSEKAWEHTKKADNMAGRAAGILEQAEHAIYSDDTDAVERLEERIADLEAKRARIVSINAHLRKHTKGGVLQPGATDGLDLTPAEEADLLYAARLNGRIGFPPYVLSNLSGNLKRQRDRLPGLRRLAEQRELVRVALAAEAAD